MVLIESNFEDNACRRNMATPDSLKNSFVKFASCKRIVARNKTCVSVKMKETKFRELEDLLDRAFGRLMDCHR